MKHKNNKGILKWNKDRIGKTYEEIYGEEKAKTIRKKLSILKKGKQMKDSQKRIISNSHINRSDKQKSKFMKSMLKNREIYPNEKKLWDIIKKNKLPFNYTGNGKVVIGGFCPDFLSKNPKHIIELFGYRHYGKYDKMRDKRRFKAYSSLGYKTLVIYNWELDNTKNHEINVINKIKEFIK